MAINATKREEWTKRVERWKDSGLTAKEFAAETGVSVYSLNWWKWRLTSESQGRTVRKAKARPPTRAPAMTFVEVPTARGVAAPLEIMVRSTFRIAVHTGFDATTLEAVLDVLERRR